MDFLTWANKVVKGNAINTGRYKGKIISDIFEFNKFIKKLSKCEEFAYDAETTSLRVRHQGKADIVGLSFCWGANDVYYLPLGHELEENLDSKFVYKKLREIFKNPNIRIIGHNLKFDRHVLANVGINFETTDVFDTQIAFWNIKENEEKGLKSIVKNYYDFDQYSYDDVISTVSNEVKKEFGYKGNQKVPISLAEIKYVAPYAADDAYWTWEIYKHMLDALEDEECADNFYSKQMPYSLLLFKMERRGVKIDTDALDNMIKMAEKDLEDLKYQIYEIVGYEFNIGSDQQLRELIFGHKSSKPVFEEIKTVIVDDEGNPVLFKSGKNKGEPKFNIKKNKNKIVGEEFTYDEELIKRSYNYPIKYCTEKGIPAVGKKALESVLKKKYKKDKHKQEGQEVVELILKYNTLDKLRSTYMIGLKAQIYDDGRIHPSLNQAGTTSGRLSSSEPNSQNFPRPVENPKKPDKARYQVLSEYNDAYEFYLKEKEFYDFWSRYEIRNLLIPDDGKVVAAFDYKNLEMVILAHFSQDENLLEMFAKEFDVHGYTATKMYKLECHPNDSKIYFPKYRQHSKVINFLLVYGGGAMALSENLGIPEEEAQELIDKYFDTFSGVGQYISGIKKFAHKYGYVKTVANRKRHLVGINSTDRKTKGYFERLALNSPIQGCIHGDTLIHTVDGGLEPIKNRINECVTLWDGDKFVTGKVVPSGKKQKVVITFNNGQYIVCSPDHKFLTVNTNNSEIWKTIKEFSKIEKVRLSNEVPEFNIPFTINSVLSGKESFNYKNISLADISDKKFLGEFLGYLSSNGSVRESRSVSLHIPEHKITILKKFIENLTWKHRVYKSKKKNSYMFSLCVDSSALAREAKSLKIKYHIPSIVFKSKDMARGFLRGLFDGDGTICPDGINMCFGKGDTYSEISFEVQQLLLLFGIRSRRRCYSDRIVIQILKRDSYKFIEEIGFTSEYNNIRKHNISSVVLSNPKQGRVETVKSIEITDEYVEMFDVLDTDRGQFMANGFIVHNSASDVVSEAQLNLDSNKKLKALGVEQLLQVHDEVVVQLPKENLEEALPIIIDIFENSTILDNVDLKVDYGVSEVSYARAKE